MKNSKKKALLGITSILCLLIVLVFFGMHFLMYPQIRKVEDVICHYGYSKVSLKAYNAGEKEYFVVGHQEEQIGSAIEIKKRIQYQNGTCTYFSSTEDADQYFYRNGIHHFPVSFELGEASDAHISSLECGKNIKILYVIDSIKGTNKAYIDVWDGTMVLELEASLDDSSSIDMMIEILNKTGYSKYVASFVDELKAYVTD